MRSYVGRGFGVWLGQSERMREIESVSMSEIEKTSIIRRATA